VQVKERAGLGPRNTAVGADNAAELSAAVEAAEQEAAAAAAAEEEEEEEADYGGDSDFEAGESEEGQSAGSDEQQEDEAYQEDDFVRAFMVSFRRAADSGAAAARSRQDAISAASSGSSVEHGSEVADAAEEDAEVTGRQGR
jgi:hypothetical protein